MTDDGAAGDPTLDHRIEALVSDDLARAWSIDTRTDSSGRRAAELLADTRGRQVFVKYADGPDAWSRCEIEAASLRRMAAAPGVTTPRVVGTVTDGDRAALLLEAVAPVEPSSRSWAELGAMVAHLHGETAERYGYDELTYIGDFGQTNDWTDSWMSFYVAHRVRPMLDRVATTSTSRAVIDRLNELLGPLAASSHRPAQPSLLHGDLWPGNVMTTAAGAMLIDPAISFGDPEMDLAFGFIDARLTFPPTFHAGYLDVRPLPEGHEGRRPVWQLWPLLTHVVQDGDRWLPQLDVATAATADLLALGEL